MPSLRDHAIVLRTHLLGEADRIVTLLTREHGKIRAVAKGVRKTTSRIGSRLEPFMLVDVQWATGRSLDIIQQVETLGSYGSAIAEDYDVFTSAAAMADTADKLSEHEASTDQFLLIVGALRALAAREHPAELIVDSYLLRSLSHAGWAPSVDVCAQTGAAGPHRHFVPAMGGMVDASIAPPGSPTLSEDGISLLGSLLGGQWDVAEASDEKTRREVSGVVAVYTQFHLEKGIKALGQMSRMRADHAEEARR